MNTYFHYDCPIQGKERALSAEQLLTLFNRNISKNAELLDYIGKNNILKHSPVQSRKRRQNR